jgi:hypothetical protein
MLAVNRARRIGEEVRIVGSTMGDDRCAIPTTGDGIEAAVAGRSDGKFAA